FVSVFGGALNLGDNEIAFHTDIFYALFPKIGLTSLPTGDRELSFELAVKQHPKTRNTPLRSGPAASSTHPEVALLPRIWNIPRLTSFTRVWRVPVYQVRF